MLGSGPSFDDSWVVPLSSEEKNLKIGLFFVGQFEFRPMVYQPFLGCDFFDVTS